MSFWRHETDPQTGRLLAISGLRRLHLRWRELRRREEDAPQTTLAEAMERTGVAGPAGPAQVAEMNRRILEARDAAGYPRIPEDPYDQDIRPWYWRWTLKTRRSRRAWEGVRG